MSSNVKWFGQRRKSREGVDSIIFILNLAAVIILGTALYAVASIFEHLHRRSCKQDKTKHS